MTNEIEKTKEFLECYLDELHNHILKVHSCNPPEVLDFSTDQIKQEIDVTDKRKKTQLIMQIIWRYEDFCIIHGFEIDNEIKQIKLKYLRGW